MSSHFPITHLPNLLSTSPRYVAQKFQRLSRSLLVLAACFLIAFGLLMPGSSASAAVSATFTWSNLACPLNQIGTYVGTITANPPGTYTIQFTISDQTNGQIWVGPPGSRTFSPSITAGTGLVNISSTTDVVILTLTVNGQSYVAYPCGQPSVGCVFTDGRINCSNGGVTVFAVNNSVGKFAFSATKDEIAMVPANPDKNTLIKQALNIALYRLHGGKMQVNAPNGYVYIWDGC